MWLINLFTKSLLQLRVIHAADVAKINVTVESNLRARVSRLPQFRLLETSYAV